MSASGDDDKRKLRKNSKSAGNNSKEAPATMEKGEKPESDE
jgi:hypothetical protein